MNNMIKVFGFMALVTSLSAVSVMANEVAPSNITAPRVEKRLVHQKVRISKKLAKGKITQDQAATLNKNVDAVQAKEQTMAKAGKMSKQDRKELNQELNTNSKEIKEAKVPAGT